MVYFEKHRRFNNLAMMDSKEPRFLADNQSVVSLVTQLHNYFQNSYSHFQTVRGTLLSQLNSADSEKEKELQEEFQKVEEELFLLGVLNDAFSIADKLLHARTTMNELGLNSGIYRVHHETKDSKSFGTPQ
jgi:hypothetical protein